VFKIILLTILLTINYKQSFANNQPNKKQTNWLLQNKVDLTLIENYLNNIKFLEADFVQTSSSGDAINGKLFLSRPSKMRVEYNQPAPALVIINGSVLSYTDLELEETSYLSTNSTPASLLTRANFSFSARDVEIVDFNKSDNFMKVSLVKKNKKEAGEFSLIFTSNPLKFIEMEVKNDMGEITKVVFITSKLGNKIDNKLFVIKNKNLPN
jgi:outer membrane lipoprotein-sorting protein